GAFWPETDLTGAVRLTREMHGLPPEPLDRGLVTISPVTPAGRAPPPRPGSWILLEGSIGWPVLPEYRRFGRSPQLSSLADRGVYFRNFLPSASGTIGSMNALMTGIPETGLNINYETTAARAYPTAVAETFRRLGYKTRFFYGGYLS